MVVFVGFFVKNEDMFWFTFVTGAWTSLLGYETYQSFYLSITFWMWNHGFHENHIQPYKCYIIVIQSFTSGSRGSMRLGMLRCMPGPADQTERSSGPDWPDWNVKRAWLTRRRGQADLTDQTERSSGSDRRQAKQKGRAGLTHQMGR